MSIIYQQGNKETMTTRSDKMDRDVRAIRINANDSVAVCLQDMRKGSEIVVDGKRIWLRQDVPAGHKVATMRIERGTNVVKYGFPIGHATRDLQEGDWVNEDAIQTNLKGTLEYTYEPVAVERTAPSQGRTFRGYRRKNGEVGVRNEVWIVPTVGCVNGVAERLAARLREETGCDGVDAIWAWHHNYGCSQLSGDHENTRRILRDIVLHPNAGAVLVVGLGCENNQPEAFEALLGDYDRERIRFLVAQKVEGDEMEVGMEMLRSLYAKVCEDRREEVGMEMLRIGLKCGGSDGFSGITANPLLGELSDWLVAQGGTTILTEVPEMFGAETILMNRCKTRELFEKTVRMVNDFKEYFLAHGEPVGENPSPGNKAGGISTLEEKALGCTQKGGQAAVSGVLEYGERLETNGLNLLAAPGNDLVASTALAAAGCQLVLFTTGRGTPFGSFVPTMKIATNTTLATSKPHWMDFNAGGLVEGRKMEDVLNEFIDKIVDTANGEQTCNERNGYREIAIFKNGVTL